MYISFYSQLVVIFLDPIHKNQQLFLVETMNEYYGKAMVDHEDQLSQLPDRLIHHIFAFLPVVFVVRTSFMSKRWRWMWVSTPSLYFQGSRDDEYLTFVENCLECCKLYTQIFDNFMERFKFYLAYYDLSRCTASKTVDDQLWFCTKNRVKELDLNIEHYCLPQFVLKPSTSLTQRKFKCLKLEDPILLTSTFPTLKVLSPEGVQYDNESLQNLFHGCPIMEDLHVDEHCVSYGERFDVTINGGTLRNLSLWSLTLSNQWLEGLVSEHRLLKRLTLVHCNGCRNICICSPSLKSMSIRESLTIQGSFRTPNLVFLCLCCTNKSSISIVHAHVPRAERRPISARWTLLQFC